MSVRWSPRPAQEVGQLAEDDPLVHVQQVGGGEDHHERRDGRGVRVGRERADEDEELADEARTGPGRPAEANTKKPKIAA